MIIRLRSVFENLIADLRVVQEQIQLPIAIPCQSSSLLAEGGSIENDGGWGAFGPTEVHVVPGDHFTMLL
jgi:hypothetical protein